MTTWSGDVFTPPQKQESFSDCFQVEILLFKITEILKYFANYPQVLWSLKYTSSKFARQLKKKSSLFINTNFEF